VDKEIKFTLFLKFTLIISFCLSLILITVVIFIIGLQEKKRIDEKIKNSETMTELIASINAFHIEKFSFYSLDENTKKFQSDDAGKNDILSVIVYDTDNKKLNPSGINHELIKEDKKFWLIREAKCIYKSSSNIPKEVGKVVIVFSLRSIHKNLVEARINYIFIVIITIVILDIVVALLLYFLVTKPLNILTKSAQQIASGKFIEVIDVKSKDEIGFLSENIIKMSKHLKTNFFEIQENNKKIEEMNAHLEDMVAKRTEELNSSLQIQYRLNDALIDSTKQLEDRTKELIRSEKLAALGRLVAGVAHEINTPIGIGVTASSLLEKKTNDYFELYKNNQLKRSDLDVYLGICVESSKLILSNLSRASELIKSFKQVAVDQSTDEKRKFLIKEYLNEILLSLKPKIKKTKHKILVNCSDRLEIDSYPGLFSQIVTNFIINSLIHGFTEDMEGEIIFDFNIENNFFIFEYSDNGKGIPKEYLNKIYEPFFTTKRNDGGTGLGLHIVYNIVTQKFGGTIECYSDLGKGVKFIIKMPLIKEG